MFEKAKPYLHKKIPNYLIWVLFAVAFFMFFFLIFLQWNVMKLSGFKIKNNHWIRGSKYVLTGLGCKLINGYFSDSYDWNGKYSCTSYYSDAGKSCQNSEQCEGECILTEPKIKGFSYYVPVNNPILQELGCKGIGDYQKAQTDKGPENVYEKYICATNVLKGACSSLPWNRNNNWELNNNEINYLEVIEAI